MDKIQILQALAANSATKGGLRLSATTKYTVKYDGDMTKKLPPQARKLLEIMFYDERDTWTEIELHDLFSDHPEITEKQTPWAIFKWYRQTLIDAKWLVMKK